jgi:hypothetical protein
VEDHKDQILLLVLLLLLLEVAQAVLQVQEVMEVRVEVVVAVSHRDLDLAIVGAQKLQGREVMEELVGILPLLITHKVAVVVVVLERMDKMPPPKLVEMVV